MLGHFMRGFVLVFSSTSRDSLLPPAFIACELQDKLITARDGLRLQEGDVRTYFLILTEEYPPHLQRVVTSLKECLSITPEVIASWQAQYQLDHPV